MVGVETRLRSTILEGGGCRRERPETWESATHPLGESLEADLLSLLLEKKWAITGYNLRFEDGRLWQSDGRLFEEAIMEMTLAEFSDPRFEAEKLGWERLEKMMRAKLEVGGWFVIASPPGETYRFEGSKPMSATFLFKLEKDGRVRVFSIYEPEMSVEEHWRRVTLTVPEENWFQLETAEEVVAAPVYVGGDQEIEAVLREFGIEGLLELERRVQVLEEKVLSPEAETKVIKILAQRLRELVPLGYDQIMDKVVVITISAWVQGELIDWQEMGGSFESWIDAMIYQFLGDEGYHWQALMFAYQHDLDKKSQEGWQERWEALVNDPYFREVLTRGMHGSGDLGWLSSEGVIQLGLDPLGWRFEEKKKEKIQCPKCQHQFVTSEKGEVRCPKCGARVS